MNISDLLKSNFLENVTSVSVIDMVIAMVLAFGIGVFIYLVYKKTYKGVMYSSGFGITLVALTMQMSSKVLLKTKPFPKKALNSTSKFVLKMITPTLSIMLST